RKIIALQHLYSSERKVQCLIKLPGKNFTLSSVCFVRPFIGGRIQYCKLKWRKVSVMMCAIYNNSNRAVEVNFGGFNVSDQKVGNIKLEVFQCFTYQAVRTKNFDFVL